MASKKENLKSLFSNTRTRVIIIFTTILLVFAVVIGYIKLRSISAGPAATANLGAAPGAIQSIPGVLNPTAQYAKLQEEQNLTQAQQAIKSGGSAIPTIIRTQALGQGVGVIGSENGKAGGVGFATLARESNEGNQRSLWIQALQAGSCSKSAVTQVVSQGAQLSDLKAACSCVQLKDDGYSLQDLNQICACKDLKAAGFNARQLKDVGYTASRLRDCGFDACELRNAGFTAQEMKDAGFTDGELKGAGFSDDDINKASGLPEGVTAADILKAGCSVDALTKLRKEGVSASAIRRISGCSAEQLKAAGFTAKELRDAGFTAAELKRAGFTPEQLRAAGYTGRNLLDAGYTPEDLTRAGFTPAQIKEAEAGQLPLGITLAAIKKADCSVDSLKKERAAGVSAATIRKTFGCSAKALKDAGYTAKELKDAGFTAAELKNAGFSAKDLKDAGFSPKELKDAGFSAQELKNAGFTAAQLKAAGFSAKELKGAGFTAGQLKAAGFTAADLKDAGFPEADLKGAGFTAADLINAGFPPPATHVAALAQPSEQQGAFNISGVPGQAAPTTGAAGSTQELQAILGRQAQQMAEQKYQQKIQQKSSDMLSAANQALAEWRTVSTQTYAAGNHEKTDGEHAYLAPERAAIVQNMPSIEQGAIIKTGDILFAVMDTSVNSDEPGPILATIVSGKLKGTKLIGSFNLPSNGSKMVITFNTMSVPGAPKSTSISAFAIDPNTARTAISTRTNHHYLLRYGALFASSFLEGFGNAFQSANTTVTIGGTGGGNDVTVSNGVGRSTLDNAVIGLATVGKTWGQQAQQLFNTPTTVDVFSGTPIGVLFTQDVRSI